MNTQELYKALKEYQEWPYDITVRIYESEDGAKPKVRRLTIIKIDSDEDGLFLEVEE